jgi:hypothetical protein
MIQIAVPKVHRHLWEHWAAEKESLLTAYAEGQVSFVPNLLPEQAVQWTAQETITLLRHRLGEPVEIALHDVEPPTAGSASPSLVTSPLAGRPDGGWLRETNMVGINVRTVGSFWNVVKYALTLSAVQDSIHLLPIWEPGVVGSLYGMSSWNINSEFYSQEWAAACPWLDSAEKQLKALVNILHVMGKAVGMDVIPHTDRFSEVSLAFPHYFEWLQREGPEIIDHSENLHTEVQDRIWAFLRAEGAAVADEEFPSSREALFSAAFPEEQRLRILFGRPADCEGRSSRRNQLVRYLHAYGYEPVPATMAPPFRGLSVDPESRYIDSQGNVWYDYQITEPQLMSRVFNPLARYKLYDRLDDNAEWQIDFQRPRQEVWQYVCEKYYDVQRRYGFDFMRGDMSHVQMRPEGVPDTIDEHYDLLRAVKNYIQQEKGVRHFGYFAETFLAARHVMVYGDEVDHLEASDADATLGDLQSTSVGSPEFLQRLRWYHDLAQTRGFAPSFTVITADKDDPRFDAFYLRGNALRFFVALFLTDMPSYMGLGFETRDVHHAPAANEHYTKLFVFQERSGPKATSGPYVWGRNGALFGNLTRMRLYADGMFATIRGRPTRWLIPPDATGLNPHFCWTQGDVRPDYVFVANADTTSHLTNVKIPAIPGLGPHAQLDLELSTAARFAEEDACLKWTGKGYTIRKLAPGEGRAYRIVGSERSGCAEQEMGQ